MKRAFDGQPIDQDTNGISGTHILQLNDDCLRKVLDYLDISELAAFADVCSRFQQVAKIHFPTTKYKNLETEIILEKEGLLGVSKVLRNFGAYIVSINAPQSGRRFRESPANERVRFSIEMIKLICCYCGGSLEELKWDFFIVPDELGEVMQPLIARLKRLHLFSPKDCALPLTSLPQTTTLKLETLSIDFSADFALIDGYLARSPHLRKLQITYEVVGEGDLLQSIATHIPLVENIDIRPHESSNFNCLAEQLKLNTLHMRMNHAYGPDFLQALTAVDNVTLEHFELWSFRLPDPGHVNKFTANLPKLKTIKTLKLHFIHELNASHVINVAKNLNELVEFYWSTMSPFTKEQLLELIRNANALQRFTFSVRSGTKRIPLDRNIFMELVSVVKNRPQKTHLRIDAFCFFQEIAVPNDLISANSDSLTIESHF